MGILAISSGISQAFTPGYQHRSTEVWSQDCSSRAPGPTVGVMEASQTQAQPNSHVYMPTKPTAAKARCVPATGALVVCSNVPQVLHLHSQQQFVNKIVYTNVFRFHIYAVIYNICFSFSDLLHSV